MKNLIFSILIIFQTIGNLFAQEPNNAESFSIIEIPEDTFNLKGTVGKPQIDYTLIKKEDGQIKIPNSYNSGSFLTYTDDHSLEESRKTNEYLGYYTSIKKHLIRTVFYEGVKYTLIGNHNTEIEIWDIPVFSPDLRYFLTFMSYGLEGEPIGIQIWEVNHSNNQVTKLWLKKIFELNQLLFDPIQVKWSIDNSILIKGQLMENHFFPTGDSEFKYWRLRFK